MSSSKKQSFSESELEALGLWNVEEQFDSQKESMFLELKKETKSSRLTVKDIEDTQKQAYEEAFIQGKKEGHEKGYEEGFQKGLDEGSTKGFEQGMEEGSKKAYEEKVGLLQKKAAEFNSLLESLSEPFKELDESVEKELVDLSIGIAHQLIRREIKIDPGQIVAVIREAINALPFASQQLTLHMHPDDAELVRSSLALHELSSPWNIIEEPLITRGGCKVETETSKIDVTVENRLAAIVATIIGGEREQDSRQ